MEQDPSPDAPAPSADVEALRGTPVSELTQLTPAASGALERLRRDVERFDLEYRSALLQVEARLEVLRDEFTHLHDYNPIEHIVTRVKSPESILRKASARGLSLDLDALRTNVTDIAGARVIVSFARDVYRVFRQFTQQPDIRVLEVEDYISRPKPSGYRSLHCLVQVPIHLSTGTIPVTVEMQFRTSAMDFWATLEHKINYKFDGGVPPDIATELVAAARVAADLDTRMERLHDQVQETDRDDDAAAAWEDDGGPAFEDEPDHFLRWLDRLDPAEQAEAGERTIAGTFVRRSVYGRYIQELLREAITRQDGGDNLFLIADQATAVRPANGRLELETASGRSHAVDAVVLALGNLPPERPSMPGYMANPWARGATAHLSPDVPVVLRAELYAVAALVGAGIVVGGHLLGLPVVATAVAGGLACFALRLLALRRGWRLPVAGGAPPPDGDA